MIKDGKMPIRIGQVVFSKAGRDEGKYYMVLEVLDEKSVTIVDGSLRKFSNPKKKNIKHLRITEEVLEAIAEKINNSVKVYDAELYNALKRFN